MSKVFNSSNGGSPVRKTGDRNIKGYNISPDLVTATAAGTLITVDLIENYDQVNVEQDSAGTDKIVLSTDFPVGTVILVKAESAISVGTEASSGIGINAGTDAQVVAVASGSTLELHKVGPGNWTAVQKTAAGVLSTPTAS